MELAWYRFKAKIVCVLALPYSDIKLKWFRLGTTFEMVKFRYEVKTVMYALHNG